MTIETYTLISLFFVRSAEMVEYNTYSQLIPPYPHTRLSIVLKRNSHQSQVHHRRASNEPPYSHQPHYPFKSSMTTSQVNSVHLHTPLPPLPTQPLPIPSFQTRRARHIRLHLHASPACEIPSFTTTRSKHVLARSVCISFGSSNHFVSSLIPSPLGHELPSPPSRLSDSPDSDPPSRGGGVACVDSR